VFDDGVVGEWVRWSGEAEQDGGGIACGGGVVGAGEEEGMERVWVLVLSGFYQFSV